MAMRRGCRELIIGRLTWKSESKVRSASVVGQKSLVPILSYQSSTMFHRSLDRFSLAFERRGG